MRFDESTVNKLKEFRTSLRILILKYSDVESEEYEFLRHLHTILDGGILLSKKKCVEFSISSGELEKFKVNVEAEGLSPDEVIEDLIHKYNKRG